MANRQRISCIKRGFTSFDPRTQIARVGGIAGMPWSMSQAEAIACIEAQRYDFYAQVGDREYQIVIAEHANGKYLTTASDIDSYNALVDLPECTK